VLTLVLALLLTLASPPVASAEVPALSAVTADAARLQTLGHVSQRFGARLPAAPELTLSAAVPLSADAAGREGSPEPGDGWLAAGVETVSVAPERAPGQPLYEPRAAQRLALYEIRFEAGAEAETDGTVSTVRALPAPAVTADVLRSPRPLTRDGALDGIAWLEGDGLRTLAVRFAPRSADPGSAWGVPETVAAPGPGSQLALAAAHLDDGSTLLAWSRFDGQDDEIYWSLRREGAWSEPRSLAADDATPDVTPVLRAVPGGALAAWAGYEADGYRVFLARWDGETWSEPAALPGPGSFPSFEAVTAHGSAGGAPLLYRSGPDWRVIDVDPAGHPVRQARLRAAGQVRPRVTAVDGGGPTLGGPTLGGPRHPGSPLGSSLLRWEALPEAEAADETMDEVVREGSR